ncbi:Jacalin-related lectin 19 [Dichanthelium oligosanthes]|uniref:Jacalin-related lectin 19 n=1 Tax=Dichanthelium oligosanthes TaxID=888268 RepID=A0A1E5VRR5_9POAL|nr:Jacalin-related lectin 19 [Dichanthelium oligosanthes]
MVVSKKLMKVGPWGGAGGHPWDDGGHSGIRSITVSYDRSIDSISVEYDRDGLTVPGERHGGAGGTGNHTTQARTTSIKLSFPDEYLTTVSGHYSPIAHGGSPVIRSLAFRTNREAYGPFGVAEGTPFTFPVDGGVIVGFCGRSGWQLDAVGLYVAPLRPERMSDRVQQLGLSAYRAVWQRIGRPQQRHEPVEQLNGNAQIIHKT